MAGEFGRVTVAGAPELGLGPVPEPELAPAAVGAVARWQDWRGNRVAAEAIVPATAGSGSGRPCWAADRPVAATSRRTGNGPTFANADEPFLRARRWPYCHRLAG